MQINRQVGEAVRIRRRGEGNLLNSKDEFNRCKITRLSLPPAKNTVTATDHYRTIMWRFFRFGAEKLT